MKCLLGFLTQFLKVGVLLIFPFSNASNENEVVVKPKEKFVDLSYSFNNETVAWPGRTSNFTTEFEGTTPWGWWYAARSFSTSEHTSTHIDAPYHFNENGRRLHEIPFEDLIDIPGIVIDIFDKVHTFKNGKLTVIENYALKREDVIEWEAKHGKVPQGAIVMLRTGWDLRWGDPNLYRGIRGESNDTIVPTNMNYPGFSASAAKFLAVERQIRGAGIDTLGIDIGQSRTFPAHRIFTGKNIFLFEMVANLRFLPTRGFKLIMLPFKIDGATGAPCRIIARVPGKPHGDIGGIQKLTHDDRYVDEEL